METSFLVTHIFLYIFVFKSYYIVWKPYEVTTANDGRYQFKSYYVVWKPSPRAFSPHTATAFKSYYVVWKLGMIFLSMTLLLSV